MYDLRALPSVKHVRAYGAFLLGLVFAFQVNAAPFTSTSSGDSVTFAPGTYSRDAAAVGAALAISAGVVYATQPATLRTVAGAVAPLVVRAAPVAGAIGSAVLACFGNPACVVVTAAAAAYVANELSYGYNASTGAPVVTKSDPNICTVAPCYGYYAKNFNTGQYDTSTTFSSPAAACAVSASNATGWSIYYNYFLSSVSDTFCTFQLTNKSNGANVTTENHGTGKHSVGAQAPVPVPSSPAELASAIGAKTDWASDSKITDLLEQIVRNTTQSLPLQIPSITGPTSIVDTPTVQTKSDGSTTTTTRTTNFGYLGPTATASEIVQVTDRSPTGVVTGTITTTAPTYTGEQEAKNSYDIPLDEIPKTTKTITFSAENLGFAAGTCPANVNQVIAGKTVKVIDWVQNCNYVTTYAKPMIWALATFAALMIIFVGKPE
jgi:hypothetical protein